MKKTFYITTTLPYVNADPHIGFAMEIIHADIVARWKKSQGYEVFFNTGTDEHGQKVYKAALAENKDPKIYCDELAEKFKELAQLLGLSEDLHFIRTTDTSHIKAAQRMWQLCSEKGYIDFRDYQIKYCTGCELEKTDSELVNGRCSIHPDKEIEIREEMNYFFVFSKLGKDLLKLYDGTRDDNKKLNVVPDYRLNEVRALIDRGLEDFSISRLKKKMPWGIPVPGLDPNGEEHVMYVWFDALTSYISTLGWPDDLEKFEKFWVDGTPTQFAGKDQMRQQSAMWQAMLMAVGLPPTENLVIHGFLNIGGQKMSKSIGNVINPKEMVERYGPEATRLLLAGVNQLEDTDVNIGVPEEGFDLSYTNNLEHRLGNLVARIMKLAEDNIEPISDSNFSYPFKGEYIEEQLNKFRIDLAIGYLWEKIRGLDEEIQEKKPWESKDKEVIENLVSKLGRIGHMLKPFSPKISETIIDSVRNNKKPENLFPRLNA